MFKACDQTWLRRSRCQSSMSGCGKAKREEEVLERLLWPTRNKTFVPDPEPRISIYVWRDVPLAVQTGLG